jgi:hypothetical protein
MRKLFLAVAMALGFGFAATGSQAATIGSNVSALQSSAKAGNSLVEKTQYYRRNWRHRHNWRHRGYNRPWGYSYRRYGWRHNYYRPYYRHHHRHHRYYR